jgi:transposase
MGRKSSFTLEFKAEAVELANRIGISKAAKELGVTTESIRRWKGELGPADPETDAAKDKEIARLRKELEYHKKINEVLKKSHGIFAQDHLKNSK